MQQAVNNVLVGVFFAWKKNAAVNGMLFARTFQTEKISCVLVHYVMILLVQIMNKIVYSIFN